MRDSLIRLTQRALLGKLWSREELDVKIYKGSERKKLSRQVLPSLLPHSAERPWSGCTLLWLERGKNFYFFRFMTSFALVSPFSWPHQWKRRMKSEQKT
jgi:hypothetical protein